MLHTYLCLSYSLNQILNDLLSSQIIKSVSKDTVMKINVDTLDDHFPETKNFTHNEQSQCGIT